jgi:hypothetical protein
MEDKGISVERRFSAPHERVFTAASRALTDLGYVVVRRYLGATDRLLQAAPRLTWDDCVSADVIAVSKHAGVLVFVVTRAEGDSTLLRVGAETLTKVPNVIVRGSPMNADLIVKMCAILSLTARVDTILAEPGLAPLAAESSAVAAADTMEYHHLLARLRGGEEEYALLRALRLEMATVAGMQCGPNLCDRIEAASLTGKRSVLYFDLGIPQTWAMRALRRR